MLVDEPPDIGHIYVQQPVDVVARPIHVEAIVSAAASGWELYDAISERNLRHKDFLRRKAPLLNTVLADSESHPVPRVAA